MWACRSIRNNTNKYINILYVGALLFSLHYVYPVTSILCYSVDLMSLKWQVNSGELHGINYSSDHLQTQWADMPNASSPRQLHLNRTNLISASVAQAGVHVYVSPYETKLLPTDCWPLANIPLQNLPFLHPRFHVVSQVFPRILIKLAIWIHSWLWISLYLVFLPSLTFSLQSLWKLQKRTRETDRVRSDWCMMGRRTCLVWFSPACTSGKRPSSSARSGRSRAAAASGRFCSGWCLESSQTSNYLSVLHWPGTILRQPLEESKRQEGTEDTKAFSLLGTG